MSEILTDAEIRAEFDKYLTIPFGLRAVAELAVRHYESVLIPARIADAKAGLIAEIEDLLNRCDNDDCKVTCLSTDRCAKWQQLKAKYQKER